MAKFIILAIVLTIIGMLFLFMLCYSCYRMGLEETSKEYKDKLEACEQLAEEYRVQLAEVRLERKLNKKNAK